MSSGRLESPREQADPLSPASGTSHSGSEGSSKKKRSGGSAFRNFFHRIASPHSRNRSSVEGSGNRMGNGASSKKDKNAAANAHNSSGNMPSGSSRIVTADGRAFDIKDVETLLPKMENDIKIKEKEIKERDSMIRKQESVINEQLARIEELTSEITELKAECDKLRSVLAKKSSRDESSKKSSRSSGEVAVHLQQERQMQGQNQNWAKKQGVSAESDVYKNQDVKLIHHKKSANSKQLIRNAITKNDFLRHLDSNQVVEMVECMYEKSVPSNCWVIREGESGAHLYVAAEGDLEVSKDGKPLGSMGAGRVFGELAILYNCTRTASVKAITSAKLWVLDRGIFQMITMNLGLQRHETLKNFIHQVPLLKDLSPDRIGKLADVLEEDFYAEGTYIVREGERGDRFFVISSGEVRVTQLVEGHDTPQEIRTLKSGEYFGEKALLGEEVRTASVIAMPPGVEVFTLDRESFKKLIGDLAEIKQKDYGDEKRGAKRLVEKRTKDSGYDSYAETGHISPTVPGKAEIEPLYQSIELTQLKSIATLGVGGFGRVELVYISGDKSKSYALKAMKKRHIVDTRQQEHIFSERNIMLELRSVFVTRLFKTFRDKKFVYMLLEACLGGELWTILRDKGHFDDSMARFYTACVLEALEYLHDRGIIYRDLKPENCLLDSSGYLKVVDFGFAKKLGGGRKTWTFCGTPEYVAPEIILNKGHDRSADFWALGIYICELLIGRPPFQASDPMKTYTLILKGVDALDIPNRRVGKTVTTLVKKLCRDNPGERLGCQSGGIEDIRKHKWFVGMDWDNLRARKLKPPHIPKISHALDASNFDQYPPDTDIPPDENSGWDEGF